MVRKEGQEFVTETIAGASTGAGDALETVLENGVLRREQTLDEIRAIAASYDTYQKKAPPA
jgi:hypothetical protein